MTPPAETLPVKLSGGRDYTIHLNSGGGLSTTAGEIIAGIAPDHRRRPPRAVVITQSGIARRWAAPLLASLSSAGFGEVPVITFPAGERYKTLATMARLCDKLYNLSAVVDRKTIIIALGGGVVGDVAGFVASIYLRGLPYVQIPTTLLAMVDSSVGGKTGVDFREGKNLIGAFHQPRAVLIDFQTLATLPKRELRAGMAEVIKYGVICDPALLAQTGATASEVERLNPAALLPLVRRSCEIKAEIVEQDEFEETGLRAILNYGHTIGHALEAATRYRRYRHGEAVGIGMIAASEIGAAAGVTPPEVRPAIEAALKAYHLPVSLPADIAHDDLLALLSRDKKAEGGKARFVLASRIGKVTLMDNISETAVRDGLKRATEQAS